MYENPVFITYGTNSYWARVYGSIVLWEELHKENSLFELEFYNYIFSQTRVSSNDNLKASDLKQNQKSHGKQFFLKATKIEVFKYIYLNSKS